MLILPIETWHEGDRLVDPTGAMYDPNSPPEIIAKDEILDTAMLFAERHAQRIGVTVLCGLQSEAADLGAPGEFEKLMAQTDVYGSSEFATPKTPEETGYARRVENAMMHFGRDRLVPFNTMEWDGVVAPQTASNLTDMRLAVESAMTMQELDMASLGEIMPQGKSLPRTVFAGRVHLLNHFNWFTVANACHQVRSAEMSGDVRLLIDEGGAGLDVARIFGLLGIQATVQEMRRDAWPPEIVGEILDFGVTAATGRIPANR